MGKKKPKKDFSIVANQVEALRLFNERAERFDRATLKKLVQSENLGFIVAAEAGGPLSIQPKGARPTPEMVDAFAANLRFFIQDNEPCSFANLAEVYQRAAIAKDLKRAYADARIALNNFLARKCTIVFKGKPLTFGEIMDVFVYGDAVHSTRAAEYREWAAHELAMPLLKEMFLFLVVNVLYIIDHVAGLNKQALVHLPV